MSTRPAAARGARWWSRRPGPGARAGWAAVVAAALVLGAPAASALTDAERLAARLDPAAARAVIEIVEAARAEGLPTGPLVAVALEGAARAAPAERVIAAVRAESAALHAARRGLGRGADPEEIAAAAPALRAGVAVDSLAALRAARRSPRVVALVVMADLAARGVPAAEAAHAVIAASRAGCRDAELMALRERVARDIRQGAPPPRAAAARVRTLLLERAGRTGPEDRR